jgi:hypothetical protein
MQHNSFALNLDDTTAFCGSNKLRDINELNDPSNKDLITVANLSGFYIRLLENAMKKIDPKRKLSIKPAFNNQQKEDLGDPVVTVRRTNLAPLNLSIYGDKKELPHDFFQEQLNEMNGINKEESYSITEMFVASFTVSIYANTLAETTRIQEDLFSILFASSFGVVSDMFSNIQYVSPPTATEVMLQERNMEVYIGTIMFDAHFLDTANILVKGILIESAKMAVEELPSINKISLDRNLE